MQNNTLTMETVNNIELSFRKKNCTSKHDSALFLYTMELLHNLKDALDRNKVIATKRDAKKCMLNNAESWLHYSEAGNSLCYTYELLERMYTKSQRTRFPEYKIYNGELLRHQARYLSLACWLICYQSKLPN